MVTTKLREIYHFCFPFFFIFFDLRRPQVEQIATCNATNGTVTSRFPFDLRPPQVGGKKKFVKGINSTIATRQNADLRPPQVEKKNPSQFGRDHVARGSSGLKLLRCRAPGSAEFGGGVAAAVATTCSRCECSRVAVESRVVFGLVDRPEFDLRHMRCPFLSADPTTLQNSASAKEDAGAAIGGGGISDEKRESAGRMLDIDAVIVTDRELMYELDTAALRDILRTRWAHGLDSLSFDRAVTVAWILEPPVITSTSYAHVRGKPRDFDLVFSHDEAFLSELPDGRGHYVPLATCLIPSHQRAIHSKSKLVSILASARAHAPGHVLRHAIISQLGGRAVGVGLDVLDAFGQAFDGQVSFFLADSLCVWGYAVDMPKESLCSGVPEQDFASKSGRAAAKEL